MGPFALTQDSDVVFEQAGGMAIWSASTRTTTVIVQPGDRTPDGGTFRNALTGPVVNDSGVVAFAGLVHRGAEGIFTWTPGSGLALAVSGRFLGTRRLGAIAINGSGQIAFTSKKQVSLFQPASGSTVLASRGSTVGLYDLKLVTPAFVGIDSNGQVAFEGRFSGGGRAPVLASGGTLTLLIAPDKSVRHYASRLTDHGHVIWERAGTIERYDGTLTTVLGRGDATPIGIDLAGETPTINESDDAAFPVTRGALWVRDGGSTRSVVRAGDPIPGDVTIAHLGRHVASGASVVFFAADQAGNGRLVVSDGAGLRTVVASGDLAPRGGTFVLAEDQTLFAVHGRSLFFTSATAGRRAREGLFRAGLGRGRPALLVPAGLRARIASFDAVEAAGDQPAFAAALAGGRHGIFIAGPRRIVTVALTGRRIGRSLPGRLESFDLLAASDRAVVFTAHTEEGEEGLFLWEGGRRATITAGGNLAPGGGAFSGLLDIALDGELAAFVASIADTPATEGVFQARLGTLRGQVAISPLVLARDATPIGGSFVGFGDGRNLSVNDATVTYTAELHDAGAAQGLFSTDTGP